MGQIGNFMEQVANFMGQVGNTLGQVGDPIGKDLTFMGNTFKIENSDIYILTVWLCVLL